MSTVNPEQPKKKTIISSNPILRRMSKTEERAQNNAATYTGIAAKTTYFLLVTVLGIMAQLLVMGAMANEPVWQNVEFYKGFTVALTMKETIILSVVTIGGLIAELVGIFARKTVPVTGTLYAASQGYVISFIVFKVLKGYEYIGLEALLLTIAVIAVMSWLYTSGTVKVNSRFRTILLTLILGSILIGVMTFVASLIPATKPFVQAMRQNTALVIGIDVLGLIIAAMFLISDFSMIDTCVKEGYPKEYEWSAAFGLVFTVIWIYLKILDLLITISGKNKD